LGSYPLQNRYVWLKTNIRSAAKQIAKMDLGYNKNIYVFINRKLLYIGKNEAGHPYAKNPSGRIAISNTMIEIPVLSGDNEILIGIAAPLYGWGIIGRVESLNGLTIDN
jgi:hypothetical protein